MKIRISNEAELDRAAVILLEALGNRTHVALDGPMGAGKTTLTTAVGRALGVADEVNSPTFSIINEYRDECGNPVFHFDFYRIESPQEAIELGLEEYFDSGALCLMEWPGNIGTLLPDDAVHVIIRVEDDGARTILIDE